MASCLGPEGILGIAKVKSKKESRKKSSLKELIGWIHCAAYTVFIVHFENSCGAIDVRRRGRR